MKDYRVVITKSAEECLLDIAEYIALDNPVRAISFIEEIATALRKTLSLFPYAGTIYDSTAEASKTIRSFAYKNYTSYYQVNEPALTVDILFIINAKREVTDFLQELNTHDKD